MDAGSLDHNVGASQRCSQICCSKPSGFFCTTDISKAFLQGVMYKELVEATGEPMREVNFVLPAYCVAVLWNIPGYENFDIATEVLHCERPGLGCNDALRCFSLKLAQVTRNLCGLKPSTVDGELCMMHTAEAARPKLVARITNRVDGLNLVALKAEVISVLQQIKKVLGGTYA